MDRTSRVYLLTKIAKKTRKDAISGKHNRKSIEKHLSKMKDSYFKHSEQLKDSQIKLEKLQAFVDEMRDIQSFSKAEMKKCHEILSCLDLNRNVNEVRIKEDGSVAYVIGKRLFRYNSDGEFVPFKKGVDSDVSSDEVDEESEKLDDETDQEESEEEEEDNNEVSEGRSVTFAKNFDYR